MATEGGGPLRTPLTQELGISYPIIQAPMGGASTVELASAVSEAGWFRISSRPVPDSRSDQAVGSGAKGVYISSIRHKSIRTTSFPPDACGQRSCTRLPPPNSRKAGLAGSKIA